MHAVEAMYGLPKVLTTSGNLFRNMSEARETAKCSFTGITHISEKEFQKLLAHKKGEI